jgi:hypothetical protein
MTIQNKVVGEKSDKFEVGQSEFDCLRGDDWSREGPLGENRDGGGSGYRTATWNDREETPPWLEAGGLSVTDW